MESPPQNITTDAAQKGHHPSEAQERNAEMPTATIIQEPTPDDYDTSSKYTEPEDGYPNDLEYPRNGNDQGIVLIFNEVDFNDADPRKGSKADVENIAFTLSRLGYNIDKKYIFNSFTTNQIEDKLNEILQEDLSQRNSLILFFLTHGYKGDMLLTRDGNIEAQYIWTTLSGHKDLSKKPKLFVFQACKGESLSAPSKMERAEKHEITSLLLTRYPLDDILLCYSSTEGMKSYRDVDKGTWFVQEICRNFLTFGRRDDVLSLLTRVTKCVSTYTHENNKQMPVIISTLSKKFYLTKRKERTHILANVELYNKIMQRVEQLEKLLNK